MASETTILSQSNNNQQMVPALVLDGENSRHLQTSSSENILCPNVLTMAPADGTNYSTDWEVGLIYGGRKKNLN